jgi:VanZ family protein
MIYERVSNFVFMKVINQILQSKYAALFWTILIFILCTLPSESLPTGQPNDKISHFIAFAGFSFFWLFQAPKYWLIILIAAIYGISIEFWQGSLPEYFHRSFDWYDALADSIGGIIGCAIYLIYKKIKDMLHF